MKKMTAAALVASALVSFSAAQAEELTIATVNNGHMIEMQKLSSAYEAETGNTLNWVTLEEGVLRQRVTTDIATKSGQFDVMTIGMYEAPIWGSLGWLEALDFGAAYDVEDVLPAMRGGLSHDGTLYAAPFYGESSMVMYRKDLVEAAGMSIRDMDSWGNIAKVAEAITGDGVYGVCLRGKPGWGDNMAFITTVVNSFGGAWFDANGNPALDTPEWHAAINFYVDLLTSYGPPGSSGNSFNEILALFREGKCGMWIDATIAASFLEGDGSEVTGKVGYAQSPNATNPVGANWLWAWALAVPAGTQKAEAAKGFIEWATSKAYIELVAEANGWGAVPTGTRQSTYDNPNFVAAAAFADAELAAILSAAPAATDVKPYVGVQFAAIPEFQEIGIEVGQLMSAALAGSISIDDALEQAQAAAEAIMGN